MQTEPHGLFSQGVNHSIWERREDQGTRSAGRVSGSSTELGRPLVALGANERMCQGVMVLQGQVAETCEEFDGAVAYAVTHLMFFLRYPAVVNHGPSKLGVRIFTKTRLHGLEWRS